LKLKRDEPLSNFAFNDNLRHCIKELVGRVRSLRFFQSVRDLQQLEPSAAVVGRCSLTLDSIKSRVESAPGVCNQRLKPNCDEPLSNIAFNFYLRRYKKEVDALAAVEAELALVSEVGPGGFLSPHHRVKINSRNEV
jgi:hypothetical protein